MTDDSTLEQLVRLQTVTGALLLDAEALLRRYYGGGPIGDGIAESLFASMHAVRALLPAFSHVASLPIPEHLKGKVWRVTLPSERNGKPIAELATDHQMAEGAYLAIAASAEEAIAQIIPGRP